MTSEIAKRCQGKWPSIFLATGVGLTEKALNGRDAPCPICGGKDRFRFSNKDGFGTWYCHGCREGGDGVKLVMLVKGVDFRGAARLIEGVIGQCWTTSAKGNGDASGDDKPKDVLRTWRDAYPDVRKTPVEKYLASRGLALTDVERAALRFYPSLWHWPTKSKWPAMIAAVARADALGALSVVTCHQTFLAFDGSGKANVDKPKLFPSGVDPAGGGVWFNAGAINPEREFVVAEGLESLLSALRLVGVKAGCAALSAWGISRLVLPPGARRVVIFADDDELQQGVAAASEARRRWRAEGRMVRVLQATQEGEDANDVWMRRMKMSGGRPA
jgi:putative DNA primase/helicase